MKSVAKFLLAAAAAAVPLVDVDPAVEAFVADLMSDMTVEEKIGQMMECNLCSYDEVKQYCVGSVMNGAPSFPGQSASPEEWAQRTNEYQAAAMSCRKHIPMIYGQDNVHGVSNLRGATVFPHNIGLGAANDRDLLREMGRIVAKESAALGTNYAFAPCIAVARDDRWGRTYESYSEDPEIVINLTAPFIEGLQEEGLAGMRGIATAKHFLADGGTTYVENDSGNYTIDQGNAVYDEDTLRKLFLQQYVEAVNAGVATVMPSYSSWNGLKMHANKYMITDVLKGELGFNGFVISDYDALWQLPFNTNCEKVVTGINSGVDMIMTGDFIQCYNCLLEGYNAGTVSIDRINDAVTRILRVKKTFGLFEHPYSDPTQVATIGSEEHREVARKLVQKSAVLLKHEKSVLPLKKNMKVFVAGDGANEIARQCGGWTIYWADGIGNLTVGTTLAEGILNVVSKNNGTMTYSKDGIGAEGHDVAVVVVSEDAYAEGHGDDGKLALRDVDVATVKNVASAGIPTVAVIFSGRPIIISDYVDMWDGIVAAFLPGSEAGKGLADVLFGDAPFTGKLSFTWPKSVEQEPINVGDATYDPLYAYGHGLTL